MKEIIIKRLEEYIRRYAEFMYWNGLINCAESDEEISIFCKSMPDAEIHRGTFRAIVNELYKEYDEDDVDDVLDDAVREAKKEGCKRAEAMRQANGIYLD